MTTATPNSTQRTTNNQAVRWAARGWSLLSIAFVLFMFIGESAQSGFRMTLTQFWGFLLFPIGVLLGMGLAWRWEKPGAALTISSLGLFYLWCFTVNGRVPTGPWFLLLAAPAFLFLAASFMVPSSSTKLTTPLTARGT